MDSSASVIETGVDKLVNLVKERGKIALADAVKILGVSSTVIQEWVEFLEEEGIISVEYNLTKPFLVAKKLTKKEVENKAKEFVNKKDIFVRRAESSLEYLEKQAEDLENIKKEFDGIKNDVGLELDTVRGELSELEKFQKLRENLQKQIDEQKDDSKAKIEELSRQVLREQKRYQELITDFSRERSNLAKEKADAKSLEESEKLLGKRLAEMKGMITAIEKKVADEDVAIKLSEGHLEKLNLLVQDISRQAEEEKAQIEPLVQKSKELESKTNDLQKIILEKLKKKEKKASDVKELTKKVQSFFEKKLGVIELVDKLNKDRNDLEKNLLELVKKAKSFQLSAKNTDVSGQMAELEKKFSEVDKKKSAFQEELKKLSSFFRH